MKQTIYLCGPINGCSDDEANGWRGEVKGWAQRNFLRTLDPMRRDYRNSEHLDYREIVELDKRDVLASDVVLVRYERPSVGTSMEVLFAWENRIPVVLWCVGDPAVSPWLLYHSTAIGFSWVDCVIVIRRILDL